MSEDKDRNLNAIQQIDPFADLIISKTTNVSLFDFDYDGKKWIKSNTEGPLFVYRRVDVPFYSLMIANRNSRRDFIEPILESMKITYEPPYIFIYKPDGVIKGLWVYGEDECKKLFDLLELMIGSFSDEALKGKLEKIVSSITVRTSSTSSSSYESGSSDEDKDVITKTNTKGNESKPKAISASPAPVTAPQLMTGSFGVSRRSVKPIETEVTVTSRNDGNNAHRPSSNEEKAQAGRITPGREATKERLIKQGQGKFNYRADPLQPVQPTNAGTLTEISNKTFKKRDDKMGFPNSVDSLMNKLLSTSTNQPLHVIENLKVEHPPLPSKPYEKRSSSFIKEKELMKEAISEAPKNENIMKVPKGLENDKAIPSQSVPEKTIEAPPVVPKKQPPHRENVGLTKDQLLQAIEHLLHNDPTFLDTIHQAYIDSLKAKLKYN